jgi:hypothetical protein
MDFLVRFNRGSSRDYLDVRGGKMKEVRDEKTAFNSTFSYDSMLYGRLPGQGSYGRA